MKKPVKLALVVASAALATTAAAQNPASWPMAPNNDGYWTRTDGQVWMDPFNLCWRTQWFSPAKAVAGCDDDLIPKAPPPPPPPPPPAAPPPPPPPPPAPPAPPPAPVTEKVTFAADAFFDFNKSVLKPEGKAKLDDLTSKLGGMALEVIIAVGHTDWVGSNPYNDKLSVRRAESVKAYLVSKGVEANRVYTEGKGKRQPIADNKTAEGRAKNRRVEIEVVGTRQVKK